jgi:uncharacterized membrane protein
VGLHPFRRKEIPALEEKKMKLNITVKDIALTAIFAALYATLVYALIPISFLALQFRFAGVLRPAIGKKWILAVGYAIGVVAANIFSPFGVWDLVFMPAVSLFAGLAGYLVAKKFSGNYFITGAIIAFIVPVALSWMLSNIIGLPLIETFVYLLISEQIICFLGALIFRAIDTRYKWWK